jgi:hypothetical protein
MAPNLRALLLLSALALPSAAGELVIDSVEYAGWDDCLRLSNGEVELIATTQVGPRIIHFGPVGGENVFWVCPSDAGSTGGDAWRIYGGHRLWASPETKPRTYPPDNFPVQITEGAWGVRLAPPEERDNGIQKEIDIRMLTDAPGAVITHRIRNTGRWPIELAPWALSVTDAGGIAIIPTPQGDADPYGLLPNRMIALWPYSDMTDPRLTWGSEYLLLRQDPSATVAFKLGVSADSNWMACANKGMCFVKLFHYQPGQRYPDFGSSVECYANADMLELETLGPLVTLEPGQAVEHTEHWFLYQDVPAGDTEQWVRETIRPLAVQSLDRANLD